MAIQFLNVVDFNLNQAEEFVLENLGTDPATGQSDGRLIFNTADNVVKVYNGAAWIPLASGTFVETVTAGTYLTNSGTATDVIIDHDLTSRSDGTSSVTLGYGATFTAVDSVTTNTTGHVTAINVKTVTLPSAENYSWNAAADSGGTRTISSGNTVDFAGGTNINTLNVGGETRFNLDNSITLTGSLTVGTTGNFTGQVTIPQVPLANTDAASKHYVDQAVTGALSYQGGYDATLNIPNLDNNPSPNPIKKGWTYTVTVDGLFFTEQVRVGDVLIAEQDAPTALGDWTTVQNNIDLASLTTVGIGNVNAATAVALDGLSVAYSSGTATVGLDINSLGTGSLGYLEDAYLALYEDSSGANYKIALDDLAAAIDISKGVRISLDGSLAYVTRTESGGLTTFDVGVSLASLGLGAASALDVKAEITTSAGQTVYADVTRSGTTLSVIFAGSVANGTYSALLVDVG